MYHAIGIRRDPLAETSFPIHMEFVQLAMFERFGRQSQFPITGIFDTLQFIVGVFLPVVTVADQEDAGGVGCPFSEDPILSCTMQSEIVMSQGKI